MERYSISTLGSDVVLGQFRQHFLGGGWLALGGFLQHRQPSFS
jgi:hypothetical protein